MRTVQYPNSAEGLFHAAQRVDVLLWRREARAHAIDADVGGPEVAPARDVVGGSRLADLPQGQGRLDADRGWVAPGVAGVIMESVQHRARLVVRRAQGEPAVADPPDALEGRLGHAADPDRDRALDRQRVDPGVVDRVPAPLEGDRRVRPE